MDHRTSINEVHQFLENQRKERLESAVSLMGASDSQLKALLYEARLAQHSLVRGSIAEIENTRKIESATLVLESRLDELSKSTLGSYVKKATSDIQDKSFDSGYHEAGDQRTNAMDLQAKADKRRIGVGSAVKRLVKEALAELDEGPKLDRFARKYIPGAAKKQITSKIKDQQFTQALARDGDKNDPLNKADIHSTTKNIGRLNKIRLKNESEEIKEALAELDEASSVGNTVWAKHPTMNHKTLTGTVVSKDGTHTVIKHKDGTTGKFPNDDVSTEFGDLRKNPYARPAAVKNESED
jgi:hypothetical protein